MILVLIAKGKGDPTMQPQSLLSYVVDPDTIDNDGEDQDEEEREETEDLEFFQNLDRQQEERIISNIISQSY